MASTQEEVESRFGDLDEIDEEVLEVHCKHIHDHPHVAEYDSAGTYFENEVGISDIADGFYDLPVYCASRIHSFAQRDFLLLQKNPNLPTDWIQSNVHWSYEDLARDLKESVWMNSLQTSKTVSGYLNDSDTVRLGLKCIIDAVQSELQCEFEGNALRQSDYEDYIQVEKSRAYRDDRTGSGAELGNGFHGEFAYTNRCKFQHRGSSANPRSADDEWLADEISAIAPEVVFALGGDAYRGLRNIGFEKLEKQSQYSDGKTGRVLRYEGNRSALKRTYAVHLYHLDYRQTLTTDRDVHDALRIINQISGSQ
ncbi:uracil-DNA glycosylase family protein [Halosimplex halophilum]|uniref:hypothetical protein n=1 Tax=Halosimplex halophilum TaxID=2559572 RepID=UPI00107FCFB3|nr:hypothetical protein [Halosimplex halophilum]